MKQSVNTFKDHKNIFIILYHYQRIFIIIIKFIHIFFLRTISLDVTKIFAHVTFNALFIGSRLKLTTLTSLFSRSSIMILLFDNQYKYFFSWFDYLYILWDKCVTCTWSKLIISLSYNIVVARFLNEPIIDVRSKRDLYYSSILTSTFLNWSNTLMNISNCSIIFSSFSIFNL
jgi:hypothetical protein